MGTKVTITLTVEASSLYKMKNPIPSEVESKCTLSDNNGGKSPNGNIKDFTSEVYIDNEVHWIGISKDSGYTIAITSIVYKDIKGSVNFFDKKTLNGSSNRDSEIQHKVMNDSKLVGNTDIYIINFSVFATATDSKPFTIDPKLKGNPRPNLIP